jgi:hypothetical protein
MSCQRSKPFLVSLVSKDQIVPRAAFATMNTQTDSQSSLKTSHHSERSNAEQGLFTPVTPTIFNLPGANKKFAPPMQGTFNHRTEVTPTIGSASRGEEH